MLHQPLLIDQLGPRARRAYQIIRGRILDGQWPPPTQLPPIPELALELGVAPMTVRHALACLREEGLVSVEQGRGTFVRSSSGPSVLIVDDEPSVRFVLRDYVERAGYRAIEAGGPTEGLAALEGDPSISLVLSDVRMPTADAGVGFIRTVRQQWPDLPLAAVSGYPADLDDLLGRPDCPVLIMSKPFSPRQIDEALRLALRAPIRPEVGLRIQATPAPTRRPAVLVADEDAAFRARVREWIASLGYDVEEVATGDEARAALERRRFGHAFLDVAIPNGRGALTSVIERFNPATVVISTAKRLGIRESGGPITVLPKSSDRDAVRAALSLQRVQAPA